MVDSAPVTLEFNPQATLVRYDPESKIKQYLQLLESENKKINLVSRETSHADLERLAAESLLPFEVIKVRHFSNYLDIGSGGGFPAFPIIISLGPTEATLIERTKKKAESLKRISRGLGLSIEVFNRNFEECKLSGNFDLITLRLVKLTSSLVKKIAVLISAGGIFIHFSECGAALVPRNLSASNYHYVFGPSGLKKSFTIFSKSPG